MSSREEKKYMYALSRPQFHFRPSVLSGVAVVGAAAVAVAPFCMTGASVVSAPAAPQIVSPAISLSAFEQYQEVFQRVVANLETLHENDVDYGLDKLLPILQQIAANQLTSGQALVDALQSAGADVGAALEQVPGLLSGAVDALSSGDVATALNTMLQAAIMPIFAAINPVGGALIPAIQGALSQPLQSLTNIVGQLPTIGLYAGLAVVGPLAGGLGGVGAAIQSVIDAASAGDVAAVFDALVQSPAVMLDGLLNGRVGMSLGPLIGAPGASVYAGGLLTPTAMVEDGAIIMPGTLGALQLIRQTILDAITPASTGNVLSSTASATVSTSDEAAITPQNTVVTLRANASAEAASPQSGDGATSAAVEAAPPEAVEGAAPEAVEGAASEAADPVVDAPATADGAGEAGVADDTEAATDTAESGSEASDSTGSGESASEGADSATGGDADSADSGNSSESAESSTAGAGDSDDAGSDAATDADSGSSDSGDSSSVD
ncbi:hypothetical protein AAFP35_18980 [Gordonia sp. CPCC 206044]|uniref:hypothetical protein n=1 Tax=Gordonia sp. CPCC 206044 TaxID=3140793 RepID=UPI003AF3A040